MCHIILLELIEVLLKEISMYIFSHFSCFRDCIDYCNDIKFLFLIMIMILLLLLLFFRKKKKIKSKGVGGVGTP